MRPLLPFVLPVALTAAAASCTGTPSPAPTSAPTAPTSAAPSAPPATDAYVLPVVAPAAPAGPDRLDGAPYLAGMRAAVDAVNRAGGVRGRPLALALHETGGDPATATALIRTLAGQRPPPPAILAVAPGPAVRAAKPDLDRTHVPLMLLQGDLYSPRQLFAESFQASIPWEWQVHVIARYLVVDRKARTIVFVGSGPEAPEASKATAEALAYWGGRLAASYVTGVAGPQSPPPSVRRSDAAVVFGTSYDVRAAAAAEASSSGHPRVVGGEDLLAPVDGFDPPPPGTAACNTYTWSGWAQPIARVRSFRTTIARDTGSLPSGPEQEGYDAVRVLALALDRSGGRSGSALIQALEGIRSATYSAFPVDLTPDDHVLPPRDALGLFAVPGATERLDPWQDRSLGTPWRPIMRTFTSDGQRDDILDMDRKAFFPFWNENLPGPYYWRSRYGIVTRPSDPLH